jgi:hypothetical protein
MGGWELAVIWVFVVVLGSGFYEDILGNSLLGRHQVPICLARCLCDTVVLGVHELQNATCKKLAPCDDDPPANLHTAE